MALTPELLDVLACPEDKGTLIYLEGDEVLYNPRLRRRYPIGDGIPILLIESGEPVDDAEHEKLLRVSPR